MFPLSLVGHDSRHVRYFPLELQYRASDRIGHPVTALHRVWLPAWMSNKCPIYRRRRSWTSKRRIWKIVGIADVYRARARTTMDARTFLSRRKQGFESPRQRQ